MLNLVPPLIKKGWTLEDFEYVFKVKFLEWKGTEYEKYLRPSTLLGGKFEEYRRQKMSGADLTRHAWDAVPNEIPGITQIPGIS